MKVTVLPGQSVIDIAIQYYGSADAAVIVAEDNQIDISDSLTVGQQLEINQDNITKKNIVNLFSSKNAVAATDFQNDYASDQQNIFDSTFDLTFQ